MKLEELMVRNPSLIFIILLSTIAFFAPSAMSARDHVEIVGSSTVFPFTARVIQNVSSKGVVVVNKSTGSGGGFHSFCSGVGDEWPDITAASRKMNDLERQRCQGNGVDAITELPIGFDGIVIANSIKAPTVNFTRLQLYLALAREIVKNDSLIPNPYFSWNEIDSSLPPTKIEVMGPPNTSGTRDMFEQLAIKHGCSQASRDSKVEIDKQKEPCITLRQDGHYAELGENDIEIIKKLKIFKNAFGIFGFSYVLRYNDIVKANAVDGILPSFETIESGEYPLSRPLYLYVKNRNILSTPGLSDFLVDYFSDSAIGEDGYLIDIGLVPLAKEKQQANQSVLMELLKP
jgi:phosphate transport system substrate-binding protein